MSTPWQDERTAANGRAVRENFGQWFGQSAMRDDAGHPKMLFHGACGDFDAFKPSRGGEYGSGIYLTEDPGSAWMYAERSASGAAGATIYAVYASLQKPYIATSRDWVRAAGVKGVKAKGHDGIIGISSTGERQIIVFDGHQIKSALGNCGLYLPTSANLTDAAEEKALLLSKHAAQAAGVDAHVIRSLRCLKGAS